MRQDKFKKLVILLVLSLGTSFASPIQKINASQIGIVHATVQLSVCGNNLREAGEQCDGSDIVSNSCSILGYDSGSITCSFACQFDTSSCVTSATANSEVIFAPSADRTYILPDGLNIFSIFVPEDFYSTDLTAYLFSHNNIDYETTKPAPSEQVGVGKFYDVRFIDDEGELVHQLLKSNTITLTYTDDDIVDIDESSLAPYRSEDGDSNWTSIADYSLNTNDKTVTFSTKDYSVFALFGYRIGAHSGGGSGSGGGSYEYPKLTPEEKKRIIKIADFNLDNIVDIEDLSILLYYYGVSGDSVKEYDLNDDKTIDIFDVSIMLYYWSITSQ